MNSVLTKAVLGLALVGPVSLAHASLITFDLSYTGIDNAATGVGTITFDDAVLPNSGFEDIINVPAATLGITAFSITIAGASAGNGTFGLADVTNWAWSTSAVLDLTTELFGQTGFNDFGWCALDFDGCVSPAPGGIGFFGIVTDAERGDLLTLASMRPATPTTTVPEPLSLVLFATGLVGVALSRRRTA